MNKQLLIAAGILCAVVVFFEVSGLDMWLQEMFYQSETREWLIDNDNAVARFIFYDGIKKVYYLFVLLLVAVLLFAGKSRRIKQYRTGLWIVMLSTILVPLAVNGLKAVTNVPCPKHLQQFGGDYPYVTILTGYPESFHQEKPVRCYPAGHASGGFALMSLFFLFRRKAAKRAALAGAIALGWLTGGYKMLIGDHFLSHTVVSMIIAWIIILLVVKAVSACQPVEN